ncbi:hypothetical protein BGZ93_008131, partial [Podila epicladia]
MLLDPTPEVSALPPGSTIWECEKLETLNLDGLWHAASHHHVLSGHRRFVQEGRCKNLKRKKDLLDVTLPP